MQIFVKDLLKTRSYKLLHLPGSFKPPSNFNFEAKLTMVILSIYKNTQIHTQGGFGHWTISQRNKIIVTKR